MWLRTAAAQTSGHIGGLLLQLQRGLALRQARGQLGDLRLQLGVALVRGVALQLQRGAGALQRVVLVGHVLQRRLHLLGFGLLAVARGLGGHAVFQLPGGRLDGQSEEIRLV